MMKHPENEHEVESEPHEDCVELAEELKSHMEEHGYPEHQVELIKGLLGELEEYENGDEPEDEEREEEEDNLSDEELEKEAHKEMSGKPHLMIKIKPVK